MAFVSHSWESVMSWNWNLKYHLKPDVTKSNTMPVFRECQYLVALCQVVRK